MKKILVLTSKYLPNPSANGINSKYIIDELIRRNYDVTCISLKSDGELDFEVINETKIHRISPSSYSLFQKSKMNSEKKNKVTYYFIRQMLRKVKLAFLLPIFPNFDPSQSRKVFLKLDQLYKNNTYDCVIGIFKPYSNIAALKKFKKKYPNVVCIGYYLDLLNSMQKPNIMPELIYRILLNHENKATLKIFDKNLIAIAGKQMYSTIRDKELLSKIYYVDFPTFQQRNTISPQNLRKDKNDIIITYAGTLSKDYRNPELLLQILDKVSKKTDKIILYIYGNNDCKSIFKKYVNNSKFQIYNNGLASHDVVMQKMLQSDILVNVSNRMQDAVPSKIFEIFSIGKPIINLVFDKNDITTDYFMKYPSVYNIKSWRNPEIQIIEIVNFVFENKGKTFNTEELKAAYLMNSPEFTVDFIEDALYSKHT